MIDILVGFRKFIMMTIILGVAITFRILGYVNGSEFASLLEGSAVAFFAANLSEHVILAGKELLSNRKKG